MKCQSFMMNNNKKVGMVVTSSYTIAQGQMKVSRGYNLKMTTIRAIPI